MTMVGFVQLAVKAASVFGLLALTVRMLRRLDAGRGTSSRRRGSRGRTSLLGALSAGRARVVRSAPLMEIVERRAVGRSSSVVLMRVREQHWVLGVTDQQVQLLLEVDVDDGVDINFGDGDGDGNDLDDGAGGTAMGPHAEGANLVDLRSFPPSRAHRSGAARGAGDAGQSLGAFARKAARSWADRRKETVEVDLADRLVRDEAHGQLCSDGTAGAPSTAAHHDPVRSAARRAPGGGPAGRHGEGPTR